MSYGLFVFSFKGIFMLFSYLEICLESLQLLVFTLCLVVWWHYKITANAAFVINRRFSVEGHHTNYFVVTLSFFSDSAKAFPYCVN